MKQLNWTLKLISARVSLASALIEQKKNPDAEKELLKAAELAPLDYRPAAALADFYMADAKNSDKALEWARKYANLKSKSPMALLKTGSGI